jgi:hypothetical protein
MSDETVILRTYASEMEAEIARMVLDSAGIPAVIHRDDAGGMMPSLQFLRGARLVVRRDHAAAAAEILDEADEADVTPLDEE